MKLAWIIAAGALICAGMLAAIQFSAPKALQLQTSYEFPSPQAIAPFTLTDQHGNTFDNADLLGQWNLFFIGYTSCPDVCPTTMGKLTAAYPSLSDEAALQIIFLSVDPKRDSTDTLLNYANFFNPEFIAVTGAHNQLYPVTRSLGFVYAMVGEGENYQVDHSASFALVSPKGEKVAIIKPKSDTPGKLPQIKNSALIHDVKAIMGKYENG
ncbi:SCO family protein [Shewanella youngdeokensis]|uniref:SCO family protein n=1 Tax=Shewanella youngdeokensis TaxID=2999068 RepID=A0ABZ0K0P4_9GAMM|nr:SCO family protein [Shewanella sp. DAU334]